MRSFLLAAFLSCCLSNPAIACGNATDAERREDLRHQQDLVITSANDADSIFVARAVSATPFISALFRVRDRIKGDIANRVTLPLHDRTTVGCPRSVYFFNSVVAPGKLYIVYVKNNRITRAASLQRDQYDISFNKELILVRKAVGPNNSFKPKPLRGSA